MVLRGLHSKHKSRTFPFKLCSNKVSTSFTRSIIQQKAKEIVPGFNFWATSEYSKGRRPICFYELPDSPFGGTQLTSYFQVYEKDSATEADILQRFKQPTQEDIVNIVCRMYEKDGITKDEVATIVNTFPNQALDFYGAMRSRTYDQSILKWVEDSGGAEDIGRRFLRQRKKGELPVFIPPEQTVEALLESGHSLTKEQMLIMESKLSKEYMKNMDEE